VRGTAYPVLSAFASSPYGLFYGHAFTKAETEDATVWLKDAGFLAGSGSWGGGVGRPRLTTPGERLVESGRSVNDDTPPNAAADAAPPLNVTVVGSHNVNIAANSAGASQSVTLTQDNRSEVAGVADALEASLGLLGLDAARAVEAEDVAQELRQASESPSPQPGPVRELLNKAKSVAMAGTGTAVGSAIVALAEQALAGLN
jgi:hypothetical protein